MEIRANSMEYMGVNSTEVSEGCRSVEFSILFKYSLSVEFSLLEEFYTHFHTIPHCSILFSKKTPIFQRKLNSKNVFCFFFHHGARYRVR